MKKLVSIKTDETGEILYFTHKKGVDTIRKSEVVDLEFLEPKRPWWNCYIDDTSANFFNGFFSLSLIYAINYFSFSSNRSESGVLTFAFGGSFLAIVLQIFSGKRNTRNRLKLYTKSKVEHYELNSEESYINIYKFFKKNLFKYLPKNGDVIMFEKNQKLINYHKFWFVFQTGILLFCTFMLLTGYNFQIAYSFIIVNIIIAPLGMLYHYFAISIQKSNYCEVTFEGDHINLRYKFNNSEETERIKNLLEIQLFKNKDKVALIDKELIAQHSSVTELIKENETLNRDLFHKLEFSEEFRDLTPIMIEYINEMSEKQMDNDLTI